MKSSSFHLLLFLLIVSCITVLSVEFLFSGVPELFRGGHKLGVVLVNISLSYIAGCIFFFLTVAMPKRIEREQLKEHVAYLIKRIMNEILNIMQTATTLDQAARPEQIFNNHDTQPTLLVKEIDEQWFQKHSKGVFMSYPISRANADGSIMDVGDSIARDIKELNRKIDELLKYSTYIDSELIAIVSSTYRNGMVESWVNRNRIRKNYENRECLDRPDASIYAEYLFQYYKNYKGIESILKKGYSKTAVGEEHLNLVELNRKRVKN